MHIVHVQVLVLRAHAGGEIALCHALRALPQVRGCFRVQQEAPPAYTNFSPPTRGVPECPS